ncbi:MAG TPA: SIMPL domain-containing protein [Candidatus Nanoarchaeia archaeon]|nr:SIMPL domain-containing protein [Candidatus Nanoarchaeia archaeon]
MEKSDTLIGIVIIGLVAVVLMLSYGQMRQAKDTITVTGYGKVTTQPDKASASIIVQTLKSTAQEAQDENSRISTSVLSALKAAGIKESDIETAGYYLYPKYEWNPKLEKNEIVGYELRNTLKVETKDTSNVGKYLDAAVSAGANSVESVNFELSDEKQVEVNAQALAKASGMAGDKAQSIVKTLDVKLGKLVTVSESNVGYSPYVYYPRAAALGMDAAKEATTISPQDIDVSATIGLVYEIR